MVNVVSGVSAAVPPASTNANTTTANNTNPTATADKDLSLLLQSSDLLQSLASQSSFYLPPTITQVLSTLWGMFNTTGSNTITEKDVEKAILSEGGKASDAHALWVQLDPKGNSEVHAVDFATNSYLLNGISSNLASVQAAVTPIQQQQGPDPSGTLVSAFMAFGGNSDVGSGLGNFINVFV
ncbi:MAG TPA: hypothetical protein VMH84_04160 [Xanthobacteraceae bacterium]|nr:hypothetical protein [Xanthobacteraceae bacterium]